MLPIIVCYLVDRVDQFHLDRQFHQEHRVCLGDHGDLARQEDQSHQLHQARQEDLVYHLDQAHHVYRSDLWHRGHRAHQFHQVGLVVQHRQPHRLLKNHLGQPKTNVQNITSIFESYRAWWTRGTGWTSGSRKTRLTVLTISSGNARLAIVSGCWTLE